MLVRRASESDIVSIVCELEKFAKYTEVPYLYPKSSKAYDFILSLVREHFVLVAESMGRVAGFMAGTVGPHYFNPEVKVLTEILWWVNEDRRRTPAGKLLLDEFTLWGETNCDWVIVSLDKKSRVNPRSLTKRGYALKETVFLNFSRKPLIYTDGEKEKK